MKVVNAGGSFGALFMQSLLGLPHKRNKHTKRCKSVRKDGKKQKRETTNSRTLNCKRGSAYITTCVLHWGFLLSTPTDLGLLFSLDVDASMPQSLSPNAHPCAP